MNTWIVVVYLFVQGHLAFTYAKPSPEYHSHSECFVNIDNAENSLRFQHPELFDDGRIVVKFDCVQKPFETGLKQKSPLQ